MNNDEHEIMTLRDYFAAQVLALLGDYSIESIPIVAYQIADAMMSEREKVKGK